MAADTRWKQKASEKDEQDHNQAVCLWTQSQFQQKLMLIEAKGKKNATQVVCLKQEKEARLQCQETQTQIRVSGWHSLESAPQGDTDCVQLRTSESVKNGQAPVGHHRQGVGAAKRSV